MVKRLFLSVLCLLLSALPAQAASPVKLAVDKEKSELGFTAQQGQTSVKGRFTAFDADIRFHPQALGESKVHITIDMTGTDTAYDDISDTLATAEWFDSATHPKAVLETGSFRHIEDDRYEADAALTMKGETQPVTLAFQLLAFDEEQAEVEGRTTLNRRDFGIGWDATDTVADPVLVTFRIVAKPVKQD